MNSHLEAVLNHLLGPKDTRYLFQALDIKAVLLNDNLPSGNVQSDNTPVLSRAQIALLMNMLLFKGLLARVPEAKLYTDEQIAAQRKVVFDHGALRTVAVDMKALPFGQGAFSRLLEPLGYQMSGEYPLDKLKMCGFVYTHRDYPADIPQYFVSELYPERFSDEFAETVRNVVVDSKDPLSQTAKTHLQTLSQTGNLDTESSMALLNELPGCFDRQHPLPSIEKYQRLLAESAEMAWIATEGNAFNHATDRVTDLDLLEEREKSKGRAMKPKIEEGLNANIRQTAYRASTVKRLFTSDGSTQEFEVPGSFFEFIERGFVTDPDTGKAKMDLRFDSRNAQGIFKMTKK